MLFIHTRPLGKLKLVFDNSTKSFLSWKKIVVNHISGLVIIRGMWPNTYNKPASPYTSNRLSLSLRCATKQLNLIRAWGLDSFMWPSLKHILSGLLTSISSWFGQQYVQRLLNNMTGILQARLQLRTSPLCERKGVPRTTAGGEAWHTMPPNPRFLCHFGPVIHTRVAGCRIPCLMVALPVNQYRRHGNTCYCKYFGPYHKGKCY